MYIVIPISVTPILDDFKHTKRQFDLYHEKAFKAASTHRGAVCETLEEAREKVIKEIVEYWDRVNIEPKYLSVTYSEEELDEKGMAYMSGHVTKTIRANQV